VKPDVVVIGAGAAGIFAAWRAASLGKKVLVLEKTSRIGTKILISGGGKCNIAHDGPIGDVIRAFRKNEADFIRSAVNRFPNRTIVPMFTNKGLEVYTRPDGRIFPVHQTAKDVVKILQGYLDEVGVEVSLNTPVVEVLTENGKVIGVRTGSPFEKAKGYAIRDDKPRFGAKALLSDVLQTGTTRAGLNEQIIHCDRVILAAGGSSYPNSGTTGDGWKWARDLGHTVEKLTAALAPVYLELEPFDPELSGVSLDDIILKARLNGKEIARWQGDLLFTHQGVSGPTVLGISRLIAENFTEGEIKLEADLAPGIDHPQITEAILKQDGRRPISSFIADSVPQRLAPYILRASGIDEHTYFAKLEKKLRIKLVEKIKALPLGTVRTVPIEKGEVVAGGVSLPEVDPQTMASRLIPGLFLCGEVLDFAGPVGGYNLQAAFATGFVAGESAATN
jgi:predicted flavoprotein YhiN